MLRDKLIYALTRYPGVTEETALKLKEAGVTSPRALKLLDDKALKAAGMKPADVTKLREHLKKVKA